MFIKAEDFLREVKSIGYSDTKAVITDYAHAVLDDIDKLNRVLEKGSKLYLRLDRTNTHLVAIMGYDKNLNFENPNFIFTDLLEVVKLIAH